MINMDVEDIMYAGREFKIDIQSLGDMPKLIAAMEEHHQFERARAFEDSYQQFMRHYTAEYSSVTDATISEEG